MAYKCLLLGMICSFLLCNLHDGKLSFSRNKKLYMSLFTIGCILVMGFRSESVGYDTATYKQYFDVVNYTPIGSILGSFYFESMEIGFVLLMKICSYISSSYFFFQFVVSILYCAGMSRFLYRNSENCIWSSFIFLGMGLFLTAFNTQRQMLAIMFLMYSWDLFISKKYIKSIVVVLLASTIHISSVLFLMAYMIYWFRNYRITYIILVIGLLFSILNYNILINFATNYFPVYNNYYSNAKEILSAGFVKILWGIIVFVAIVVILKGDLLDKVARTYAFFSLIYIAASVIGLQFNYFERLGWIFLPFTVLLFDRFGSMLKLPSLRNIYYAGCLVSFIFYFILSSGSDQYIYTTWL